MVLRRKSDIESAFERDVEKLLAKGNKPAIATHDGYFLNRACQLAADASLPPDSFELQLLYGVRPDLQKRLKEQGYAVRCYVPFGGNWYAYVLGCIRRIPEEIVRYTQERFRSQPD